MDKEELEQRISDLIDRQEAEKEREAEVLNEIKERRSKNDNHVSGI